MGKEAKSRWFEIAVWAAASLLASIAAADAIASRAPVTKDPGFLETLLASHAVVAALRVAILSACVYLVVSIAALVRQRRWLTRVGPVETSDMSKEFGEVEKLRAALAESESTIEGLRLDLRDTESLVDRGVLSSRMERQ